MDFRDNWLTHFKAVVDKEISDAGGSPVAGRTAVGQKLEKVEQTIYQHYAQKSGKVYPTIEMMVLLEKKYGAGLPPGWAALPPSDVASLLPSAPTLVQALEVLAASLNELPDERRELAAQHLQTLARAPDSKKALEALLSTMGPSRQIAAVETAAFAGKPKDDGLTTKPNITAGDFVKR